MTTPDALESRTEVRYPIPRFARASKRGRRFSIAVAVFLAAGAIWSFSQGHIPLFPLFALAFTVYSHWRIRTRGRDAVATTDGITGPHLRHPIRWSDVAQLREPSRYDPEIVVDLADGSRKGTGFPPSYFDRLTALTSVPVKPYELFD